MNTITFNLINGRTENDMYEDIAILNKYNPTIESSEIFSESGLTVEEATNYTYPDNVIEDSKKTFTLVGGLQRVEYKTSITNPITAIEFGKNLAVKKFGKEDSTIIGDAALLRAQLGYNLG